MKKTRTKRPTQAPVCQDVMTLSYELKAIRHELAELKGVLCREPKCTGSRPANCSAANGTRYLSEPEAASYKLLSERLAGPDDTIRFCHQHFDWLSQRGL